MEATDRDPVSCLLRPVLPFLTAKEATPLRLVSRAVRDEISSIAWNDQSSTLGSREQIARWAGCFPKGVAMVRDWKGRLRDGDLAPLAGRPMTISVIGKRSVSNAFFEHATRATAVCVTSCEQITTGIFPYLRSAEDVNLSGCKQLTGTNWAALSNVRELILTLDNLNVVQFGQLERLESLSLVVSHPVVVDEANFGYLKRLSSLYLSSDGDVGLKAQCVSGWDRLASLTISFPTLTDAMLLPLSGLREIHIINGPRVSDSGLQSSTVSLRKASFSNSNILSKHLCSFTGLRSVYLSYCHEVLDTAFPPGSHPQLESLCIKSCPGITNTGVSRLNKLTSLSVRGGMTGVTPAVVAELPNLKRCCWPTSGVDSSPLITAGFVKDPRVYYGGTVSWWDRRIAAHPPPTVAPATVPADAGALSTADALGALGQTAAGAAGGEGNSESSDKSSSNSTNRGGRVAGNKRARDDGDSEEGDSGGEGPGGGSAGR